MGELPSVLEEGVCMYSAMTKQNLVGEKSDPATKRAQLDPLAHFPSVIEQNRKSWL